MFWRKQPESKKESDVVIKKYSDATEEERVIFKNKLKPYIKASFNEYGICSIATVISRRINPSERLLEAPPNELIEMCKEIIEVPFVITEYVTLEISKVYNLTSISISAGDV